MFKAVLFLATLVVVASAASLEKAGKLGDKEDVAIAFMECTRKALDGGLKSAQIPNHNPFRVHRNLTLPIDLLGVTGVFKIENVEIQNIVDFDIVSIKGALSPNADRIVYDIEVNYPQMRTIGTYSVELEGAINVDRQGSIDVLMQGLNFQGVWNLTVEPAFHLDELVLNLSVSDAIVDITGLGPMGPIINSALGKGLAALITPEITSKGSFLIQKRINEKWLAPEWLFRIDAIMDNCQ